MDAAKRKATPTTAMPARALARLRWVTEPPAPSRRVEPGHVQVRVYWEGPVHRACDALADLANALLRHAADSDRVTLRPTDPEKGGCRRGAANGLEGALISWVEPSRRLTSGDVVIDLVVPVDFEVTSFREAVQRATGPVASRHPHVLSIVVDAVH
jgi:hypothetical protein